MAGGRKGPCLFFFFRFVLSQINGFGIDLMHIWHSLIYFLRFLLLFLLLAKFYFWFGFSLILFYSLLSLFCHLYLMRFSVRLSERNGDLGKGILEIYKVNLKKWVPACVDRWNPATSPTVVCSLLGYNSVNSSRLIAPNNQTLIPTSAKDTNNIWRMYQRKKNNLIKEFGNCKDKNHNIIDLTCSNYGKLFKPFHFSFSFCLSFWFFEW